jgi:3-oxoacyl-[acyl-carrier-protein] synthase III
MIAGGYGCEIRGSGSAFGSLVVESDTLERRLKLPEGWSADRTGVRTRRYAAPGERTLDLATAAAKAALIDAELSPHELGLVICSTMTPEMPCPATGHRLVDNIGATPCGAFDLTSACTGWLAAMNLAADGIRAGSYQHILVVGADVLSPTIDQDDPKMACLFGDAAAATVVSRSDDPAKGCYYQKLHSDGGQWQAVYQPRCMDDLPKGAPIPERFGLLTMNGLAVFRFAVTTLVHMIPETLAAVGMTIDDIDLVLLHQSNLRIVNSVRLQLDLPEEKCPTVIETTGNTSGGSVGMVLDAQLKAGRVRPGTNILFAAVGGGLSWGASIWKV